MKLGPRRGVGRLQVPAPRGTGTGTGTAPRRSPAPACPSRGTSGRHGGPFTAGDAFAPTASPRLPGTLQLRSGTWGGLSPDGAAGSGAERCRGAAELPPNMPARRPARRHRTKCSDAAEPPGGTQALGRGRNPGLPGKVFLPVQRGLLRGLIFRGGGEGGGALGAPLPCSDLPPRSSSEAAAARAPIRHQLLVLEDLFYFSICCICFLCLKKIYFISSFFLFLFISPFLFSFIFCFFYFFSPIHSSLLLLPFLQMLISLGFRGLGVFLFGLVCFSPYLPGSETHFRPQP